MGELNSPGKLTTWSNLGSGGTGGSTKQIRMIDGMLFDLHFDLSNLFDYSLMHIIYKISNLSAILKGERVILLLVNGVTQQLQPGTNKTHIITIVSNLITTMKISTTKTVLIQERTNNKTHKKGFRLLTHL